MNSDTFNIYTEDSEDTHIEILDTKKNTKSDKSDHDLNNNLGDDKDITSSNNSENEKYVQALFIENIYKYIEFDQMIKDKMKEHRLKMKELKEQQTKYEKSVLSYFKYVGCDTINMGDKDNNKIIKYESSRKKPLNKNIILESIEKRLIDEKLVNSREKAHELANKTFELMQSQRPVITTTKIKRINKKQRPIQNKTSKK